MIQITREEAQEIREKMPNAVIVKTMRQSNSKRHKYYTEENYVTAKILQEIRGRNIVAHYE